MDISKINNKKVTSEYGNNDVASRRCFLDVLRVVATCAVVLLHTLTGAVDAVDIKQYPTERIVFLVIMDLITWCVPVFVLISGYLFLNPRKQISVYQILSKYCRRIVLALFLFGVPFAMLELILVERTFSPAMVGRGMLMVLQGKSWSHMWYLYMILILYLVTPAMKWLLARVPQGCVYGVMMFLLLFSSIFTFLNKLLEWSLPILPDGGIYLFYYLCGYLFAREERLGDKKQDCVRAEAADAYGAECERRSGRDKMQILAVVMLGILFAGMAASRILGNFSVQMAYNYPFTVLVAVLLFYVAKNCKKQISHRALGVWQRMSALCFTVYLVHPVFVNVLYKFLHISLLDYPIGIALPMFFAMIFILAVITAWILCKISLLKKYVL